MPKIKHGASDKILRNPNDKIVNSCGEPCDSCEGGTLGDIYRLTIPANTFTYVFGDTECPDLFNGTTKDLTTGHPFYDAPCVRALDISGLACSSPDAIVMTFLSTLLVLDFIFGSGFVRFTLPITTPLDCSLPRIVTYDSTSGSPPIDAFSGKSIVIERIS